MRIQKNPHKPLHVCNFSFWPWKIHCSFTVAVCCIAFVFPCICMEMWNKNLDFLLVKQTSLAQWEALYVEMLPTSSILIKQIASVSKLVVLCHIYEILVLHRIILIYYSSHCYYLRSWCWLYVEQVIHCLFFQVAITN